MPALPAGLSARDPASLLLCLAAFSIIAFPYEKYALIIVSRPAACQYIFRRFCPGFPGFL